MTRILTLAFAAMPGLAMASGYDCELTQECLLGQPCKSIAFRTALTGGPDEFQALMPGHGKTPFGLTSFAWSDMGMALVLPKNDGQVGLMMINDDGATILTTMMLDAAEPTITYTGRCEGMQ